MRERRGRGLVVKVPRGLTEGKTLLTLLMRERTDLERWSPMKGTLIKTGLVSEPKIGEASSWGLEYFWMKCSG